MLTFLETYIGNPYIQALICAGLIFLWGISAKLDVAAVLSSGMWIGFLFLLSSLFYGVLFEQTWWYLIHLFFAVLAFSAFWILLAVIANKWGKPVSNGEGWMVLLMPATVYPAMFAFAVVSKLILDFIRSFL